MRNFYKICIIVITILLLLVTGCTNDKSIDDNSDNKPNTKNQEEEPVQPDDPSQDERREPDNNTESNKDLEPDNSTEPDNSDPSSDGKTEKQLTFKEAFSEELLDNPEDFMGKLIPNFNVGLSKEEVKHALGEPDSTEESTEQGVELNWIYNDVKGFQLVISFNSLDQLQNFKLIKRLDGKGTIPKFISKIAPEDGEEVTYKELGFEGVVLGDSIDSVIQRYGESLYSYISYDEMYGYNLAMVYRGDTVHILLSSNDKKPYVHYIETNNLGTVNTYRGIHVGNTTEEVFEKYGMPSYEQRNTGDVIYSTEDLWFAIKFMIEDGEVIKIYIYQAS